MGLISISVYRRRDLWSQKRQTSNSFYLSRMCTLSAPKISLPLRKQEVKTSGDSEIPSVASFEALSLKYLHRTAAMRLVHFSNLVEPLEINSILEQILRTSLRRIKYISYDVVTLLAKLRGWSTLKPRRTVKW